MEPQVSVIVPVYNREKLILRCLESILNQSVKPSELIVVDNNSSDATFGVVAEWIEENSGHGIDISLLKEERGGACFARQKGLENARGDYLIFFDSDDEMHPDLIENAKRGIEENSDVDIVCWNCRIHLLDGTFRIPAFLPENPLESHLIHTLLRPQGYMAKKEFLLRAGGWSKPIEVWNDFELGLRLLLCNPRIIPIKKVLAEIFSQEESITGKDFSSRQGKWEKTIEEMERENEVRDHPQKVKIRKILSYRRAILAAQYYREGNISWAEDLMYSTLEKKSILEKLLLKFSYLYTRKGYRGVWRIVRRGYGF